MPYRQQKKNSLKKNNLKKEVRKPVTTLANAMQHRPTRVGHVTLAVEIYYSTKETNIKHLCKQLTKTVLRCRIFLYKSVPSFVSNVLDRLAVK